jgi:hypothetical protein
LVSGPYWLRSTFMQDKMPRIRANKPGAGNAGIACLLTIGNHCPGMP